MFTFIKKPLQNRGLLTRVHPWMRLDWILIGLTVAGNLSTLCAQAPRVLPEGTMPHDVRLQALKDLDGYFPFHPSKSPAEWDQRARQVRQQMLVSLGLWPMPEKTPLHAVIHGKIDCGDYTVERVYFESHPGFYVTGNLYRPAGKSEKLPGILCPHGHWADGRFYDIGEDGVRKQIAQGAERFENGGRSPLQSRCMQLARMGCVVFHYDMIGYADCIQIPQALAHSFAKQRPEMNTVENWGLFSPQAETHLQSVMGLQTWNSIRALDFLLSLPEIDASRIGVTGASGGGTQTFCLCALDPRPAVAFPAVMVSTAMQGGCTCENTCLLRVNTGNVEFAGLFAPKPLGMTAADDWTKEMATKGFPELKTLYAMLGAPNHTMLRPLLHFEHNYNYVSRAAMYAWFNQYLKLGWKEPIVEQNYRRLTQAELTVWNENHSKPESGLEFERKLLRYLTTQAEKQIQSARDSLARYRSLVGGAMDVILGRKLSEAGNVTFQAAKQNSFEGYREVIGMLRNQTYGEELPVVLLQSEQTTNRTVIWLHEKGKAGLYDGDKPAKTARKLLEAGITVIGVDLLYQGEFLADGKPLVQTRRVKNPREFAGYTFGYNYALFAQRVQDILTVVQFARNRGPHKISLVGFGEAGPWVGAAMAQAREAIASAAMDTGGFRFGKVLDLQDVHFLPGGAKYGDLPGMIALGVPAKLWLAGEGTSGVELIEVVYAKANAKRNLTLYTGEQQNASETACEWLLKN